MFKVLLPREVGREEVAGRGEEDVERLRRLVLGCRVLEGHFPFLALLAIDRFDLVVLDGLPGCCRSPCR